jgi:ABC-2 type transport system permease protein
MTDAAQTKLGRYATIYGALWKNSVAREMGFKSNFILWIIVELLWFALQLTFFNVIYSHTDNIAGWSRWEVVLLVGVSHFIQQIFQAFFLTNCVQLSELVRTGKLDFLLLLPANTRFQTVPSGAQILGFIALIICGILIHYSLMMILASTAFYTVRAQGIVWGYYNMFNLARMPETVFRGAFKIVFTFILPVTLVSNVPAKTLTARMTTPGQITLLIAMTAGWFLISELIWRFSIRRYTSASS